VAHREEHVPLRRSPDRSNLGSIPARGALLHTPKLPIFEIQTKAKNTK
jgi:hypothetical protein